LTVDLRKYNIEEILQLPDNRILLPIKVDMTGNNVIEIVPAKASMGYLMDIVILSISKVCSNLSSLS